MAKPLRGMDRRRARSFRLTTLVLLLAAPPLAAGLWAQSAPAAAAAAVDQAVAAGDIDKALAAYDRLADQGKALRPVLARIARADLGYCMKTGKGWERVEAARALAILGDPAGRKALIDALRGNHPQVRSRVAAMLASQGIKEAVPELQRMVERKDATSSERIQAGKALFVLGEQDLGRSVLVELSRAEAAGIQAQAVKALAHLEDPGSLAALKEQLDNPAEPVALWAADGAARQGDAVARKRLQARLAAGSPGERLQAAWHLRGAGAVGAVATVRELAEAALAEPDDVKRGVGLAVYTFSWYDPEAAQPAVEKLLGLTTQLRARMIGAQRLAELGHETALQHIQTLYKEVGGPTQSSLRAGLARFAGWLADSPELREFFRMVVRDDTMAVRLTALEGMAGLGMEEALVELRGLLNAPELVHRVRAAEAVLHFAEGAAKPPDPWGRDAGRGGRWG